MGGPETVNIRRGVDDKFYRYKMPKLVAKVEGKGNGIKTVIVNMSDIAKSLARPPTYPTKFFGCELGALVKFEEKADRYIVNGAHDAGKLQSLLDAFIEKFVLCPACQNPETDLTITKDEKIMRNCKACGASKPVAMQHKLTTFILKNAPAPSKKSKKDKRAAKNGDSEGMPTPPETASPNGSGDEDDEELTRRINEEAAALPTARDDDADDDWAEDTSPEAVAARMKELAVSGAVAKMTVGDDDDEEDDPIEEFAAWFAENKNATDAEILAEVQKLDLRDDKVCVVLPQVLLDDKVLSAKQIPKRAALLRKFIKNEKCQKGLLGGVERLVGLTHKDLLPKVAMVLKALYDEDLVEEEVLLAWGQKASKKYVEKKVSKEIREKAQPFLNWLEEAEEEDEDDEDDE